MRWATEMAVCVGPTLRSYRVSPAFRSGEAVREPFTVSLSSPFCVGVGPVAKKVGNKAELCHVRRFYSLTLGPFS